MSKARAQKIKLILFDVDGVMTDGTIFLFPSAGGHDLSINEHQEKMSGQAGYAIHSQEVMEAKGFNAHDGAGISLAKLGGLKLGIITKRISQTVALRARDLKLDIVHQGIADKGKCFVEILEKEKLAADEVAYVGDDIIDLPIMRRCGLAIAVRNAREEVKDESHFVTDHDGGRGACRDAIEYILRAQGSLDRCITEYIHDRSPHTPEKACRSRGSADAPCRSARSSPAPHIPSQGKFRRKYDLTTYNPSMRKLLAVLLLFMATVASAQTRLEFKVEKLADGVYALVRQDPVGWMVVSNCVFIINDEDVVVVDTGGAHSLAEQMIAELRKLTSKPVRYVINTHWHDDHILGNAAYKEAYPQAEFVGQAPLGEYLPEQRYYCAQVHGRRCARVR